jgi:hypothetical protein
MPNPGSLNVHQNELPLPITAVIKSDFKRLFGYELKVQAGTMITGELNLLAGNLVSFAEKNKITQLKNHASDLMEYVRNCEFEKIQDSLHKIGELFEI